MLVFIDLKSPRFEHSVPYYEGFKNNSERDPANNDYLGGFQNSRL